MRWLEAFATVPSHVVILTILLSILPPSSLLSSSDGLWVLPDRLIKHKWYTTTAYGEGGPSDTTVWEFYKEGVFRRSFTADYTAEYVGRWTFDAVTSNTGLLFLAERRVDAGETRYGVLSYTLNNGDVRLGELSYRPLPFTGKERQPVLQKESSHLDAASRERFYALWFQVSAHPWKRQDNDGTGQPDTYTFSREGTYAADFHARACHYTGTWSLLIKNQTEGEMWLTVPAHHCGRGGFVERSLLIMPVELSEKTLVLASVKFMPQE